MSLQELSDQALIARIREGRESAARELIRRYEKPVFSLILRLVRDRGDAEDLAQDTFIKVLKALDSYDPRRKFSSWIFKIAHNTALDHLRRQRRDTLTLDGSPFAASTEEAAATAFDATSPEPSPEEYAAGRELGQAIENAIARLRPEYRTAILLWHVEGRAYDEIAEIMDLPLGTVKTFIHRARAQLRVELAHLRAETR